MTEAGTVECEAAFMCSSGLAFGAVAAVGFLIPEFCKFQELQVTNCAHPSFAAQKLADKYKINSAPNGLIEPMILAGKGAEKFCLALSTGIIKNEQLRTENALRSHALATKLHARFLEDNLRLDTVGGVSINVRLFCF